MSKKMEFNLSINIETEGDKDFNYIVTPNAQKVLGDLINGYLAGIHSFSIIGTYGTGKSSFLMALKKDCIEHTNLLISDKSVFANAQGFEFINIVGDYAPLSTLLCNKLNISSSNDNRNLFNTLSKRLNDLKKHKKFLFIFVDEFGKILEHAANNNPEKELYFLQVFAEYINDHSNNVILITTLHQNFGSYSQKLTETQRYEWIKVKGRFKEIVFAEPVEQLLYLASEGLGHVKNLAAGTKENYKSLHSLAIKRKMISKTLPLKTLEKLYPLDPVSASCLTLAIQRYGQNERTLFSFLSDFGNDSIIKFKPSKNLTYNISTVYDYIFSNFYSALVETNIDSTNWRAINVAIERVESGIIDDIYIEPCLKIVKTIGLLNIFYKGAIIDRDFIELYSKLALNLRNPAELIDKLTSSKIIRYASYKSQYILFEGTDINIEEELYKASRIVPPPILSSSEILPHIKESVVIASASYYKTGTPRYFKYEVTNEPIDLEPIGDIDGYINIIFPLEDIKEKVINISAKTSKAILYAYYEETEVLSKHLFEIKKLQYILENVVLDDRVAKAEVEKQISFEKQKLNETINHSIELMGKGITWFYKGKKSEITTRRSFNHLLSTICDEVYCETPIIKNELFNKQRISSAISVAKTNLFEALREHWQEEELSFDKALFPPEKTIYYTLLKDTGIHHQDKDGTWILGKPTSPSVLSIWNASCDFIEKSKDKQLKLSELVKILTRAPFKLKQGVIDFWIPIFIYIKQQEFALYDNEKFVPDINKEVFNLLQKSLNDFSIKAFDVSGIKLEIFNKYRIFLNKEYGKSITANSMMDTIRPFFKFYNGLNLYAKNTRKFDYAVTAKFRDILASATDPCKAFLEDIPNALGYNDISDEVFVSQYLQLIKTAVHELVICYDLFIDRIEKNVVEYLGLPNDYAEYKIIFQERYSKINKGLLTTKSRSFLDRVLSPSETKREFYEKIGQVVFDRKIETILDREEAVFISNIIHLFAELERYTSFDTIDTRHDEIAFNFELATSKGDYKPSRTYRLPKTKLKEAQRIENKIDKLLSGNEDFDVCILLNALNKRMG